MDCFCEHAIGRGQNLEQEKPETSRNSKMAMNSTNPENSGLGVSIIQYSHTFQENLLNISATE